jgi:DNA-binding transcriptional LysR family regulator
MFMAFGPPRYEVRHLEALRAVAEEGTFRGAADVLGYSQAAISQQIAGLEALVGSPVFDRPGGPRPVILTPVGRALLTHAEAVLDRLDAAREEVADIAAGTGGRLIIGTFQSVAVELLPDIVGRVRRDIPGLIMRAIEEDENSILIDHFHEGDIDVAFIAGPVYDTSVDYIDLGTDPFVAVLPRTAPYIDAQVVSMRDIAELGLIGEHVGTTQDYIDQHVRDAGITATYAFRTNDNGAKQAMVRNGMGAAIMPQLAVDLGDPEVVVLPTDPPIAPRSILLAVPPPERRTPAIDHFIDVARQVAGGRLSTPAG